MSFEQGHLVFFHSPVLYLPFDGTSINRIRPRGLGTQSSDSIFCHYGRQTFKIRAGDVPYILKSTVSYERGHRGPCRAGVDFTVPIEHATNSNLHYGSCRYYSNITPLALSKHFKSLNL